VTRVGDCGCTLTAGVIITGILLGATHSVSAQEALRGRLAFYVNLGYQLGSEELQQRLKIGAYGEDARFLTTHDTVGGPGIDLGGSLNVWQRLSVGASYTQTMGSDTAAITGTVPHPILMKSDRTIATRALDLTREERSVHMYVAWLIDLPIEKVDVRVMGGPSYFNLTQDVVTGVVVSEVGGPLFESVSVDRIVTGGLIRNGWGGHVGADVSYMFTDAVGIGGVVRFTRGAVKLPVGDSNVLVTVGGLQMGGGARFRF